MDPLEKWAERFSGAERSFDSERRLVILSFGSRPIIDLDLVGAPPETTIAVSGSGQVFLRGEHELPSTLIVCALHDIAEVHFTQSTRVRMTTVLELSSVSRTIEVAGNAPETLHIYNGSVRVNSLEAPVHLHASESELLRQTGTWGLASVRAAGEVRFAGSWRVIAEVGFVSPGALVRGEASFNFLRLADGRAADPVSVSLLGNVDVGTVAAFSNLELRDATLTLGRANQTLADVNFRGFGGVRQLGTLVRPTFEPRRGQITLRAEGNCWHARGDVVVALDRGTICHGDADDGLGLDGVEDVTGAELENVNLFNLRPQDIDYLETATRLLPWFPGRRRELNRRLDQMDFGATDPTVAVTRRAHFWARVSRILGDKHAPGGVRSSARYAATRSRWQSLAPGSRARVSRERILLSMFRWIGFGERIGTPVYLFLTICVFATLVHSSVVYGGLQWADSATELAYFFKLFASYLLSPLTFFRLSERAAPDATTLLPELGVTAVRVMGVVLLAFSLLAIRKVTVPEQ